MALNARHAAVLREFGLEPDATAEPMGNGLIHTTLLVSTDGEPRFVLQELNTNVFPDSELCASNAKVVTDRVRQAVLQRGGDVDREVLRFLTARDGRLFAMTPDGTNWRMSHYVAGSVTIDVASTVAEAATAARAFAEFQRDLWDVDPTLVRDAIPGFHDTPRRYRKFCDVIERISDERGLEKLARANAMVAQIRERADYLGIVEADRVAGRISTHVCHNDTKVNNVLLDEATRRPLCIIDFDTVGPGSPLMDVGDLLRTAAPTASEEERDATRVALNPEMADAIVGAFATVLHDKLNEREKQLLPFSGWLITMEQAIRYLTDYLEGDVYYGERYPGHNLVRTENQMALARSMEEGFVDLASVV